MDKKDFWEYQFSVRSFDVDQNKEITLTSISEYLQEVAGDHANTMGFGYRQVVLEQMVWILGGIKIEVERYPLWEEEVTIKTWVVENKRFVSRRDFQWLDQKGNILLNASTNWILFHTERRRPVAIDSMNFEVRLHPEQNATSSEVSNIRAKFEDSENSQYTVRYSDLDMVGHMNNTKYIQLLLDHYSPDFHNNHKVKSLDINFKNEARYGDILELRKNRVDLNSDLIELKRKEDGKVNCIAQLEWLRNSLLIV